jgi:peptidoglycan hydrolase-like protein with peptidoglycan-binding domain
MSGAVIRVMAVTAIALAAVVGIGAYLLAQNGAQAAEPEEERSTATAEQRTLRVVEELDGQLGHGETQPISAQTPGTLTGAAQPGDTVERGETLFRIDEQPVSLLYGELPAWRALAEGVEGGDVLQLEENLAALGYAPDLTPDETFDADTTSAVEAWQEALGTTVDGVVDFGEVVFLPDAVWVSSVEAGIGQQVGGGPILLVADTERLVTVNLPTSQLDDLAEGDELEIELGDGSVVSGTVDSVGSAIQTDPQTGNQTVPVTISLDDGADGTSDGPVTVRLVRHEREDVLAVPVNALLALLEGGYAVEVIEDDGTTALVGVEIGLFADGWVEITDVSGGELEPGDRVVVP